MLCIIIKINFKLTQDETLDFVVCKVPLFWDKSDFGRKSQTFESLCTYNDEEIEFFVVRLSRFMARLFITSSASETYTTALDLLNAPKSCPKLISLKKKKLNFFFGQSKLGSADIGSTFGSKLVPNYCYGAVNGWLVSHRLCDRVNFIDRIFLHSSHFFPFSNSHKLAHLTFTLLVFKVCAFESN